MKTLAWCIIKTLWSILGIVSDSGAGSRLRGCVFGSFGSVKNLQHSHCTESSLDLQVSIPWSFRRWWGERAGLSKILKHCCIKARVTESHHLLHKVWWHHHASLSVHHNRNSSRQCGVLTLNRKLDKKSLRAPGSPCGVKNPAIFYIQHCFSHSCCRTWQLVNSYSSGAQQPRDQTRKVIKNSLAYSIKTLKKPQSRLSFKAFKEI